MSDEVGYAAIAHCPGDQQTVRCGGRGLSEDDTPSAYEMSFPMSNTLPAPLGPPAIRPLRPSLACAGHTTLVGDLAAGDRRIVAPVGVEVAERQHHAGHALAGFGSTRSSLITAAELPLPGEVSRSRPAVRAWLTSRPAWLRENCNSSATACTGGRLSCTARP